MQLALIPEPKEVTVRGPGCLRIASGQTPKVKEVIKSSLRSELGDEGYLLSIDKDGVKISAATKRGIFYGKAPLGQIVEQAHGKSIPEMEIRDWPDVPLRGFHFDFRVQRPTVEYVKKFMTRLASYKINQVVIEYEDHFPFKVDQLIPSGYAFTSAEIRQLNAHARKLHIELVPLQQCLAHAGYILKHNYYASLRELPHKAEMFCPQNPKTLELLERLISEIISAHPDSRYVHVGGDECYLLGECPKCADYVKKHSRSKLFVAHVTKICRMIKRLGKQPCVWGDMLVMYPECLDQLPTDTRVYHWDYYSYSDKPDNFIHNGYFGPDRIHPKGQGFGAYDKLRGLGLSVIGQPSARACPDTSFSIDHRFHLHNIHGFCRKVARVKGEGILNTSFTNSGDYTTTLIEIGGQDQQIHDSLLLTRRLPLEYNIYGILAGAAFSWSSKTSIEKYRKDFNHCFFGTRSDITGALHELDSRPRGMEDYALIARHAARARVQLDKIGKVERNPLAFDFIKVTAWLIDHKARREDTFWRYECAIGKKPKVVTSARAKLRRLEKEGDQVKKAMREVWHKCFSPEETERDMFIHFDLADKKYSRYLGRSK